jgi:methylenetetrahydrofolate dehydrogenase (NADP+)/methenyltetrahydrofolate cyclohydrolase
MVGEGVVAIDVGWPKGDFEFASCVKKASLITPVPKGVGPLTVTSLLENVLILAAPARS